MEETLHRLLRDYHAAVSRKSRMNCLAALAGDDLLGGEYRQALEATDAALIVGIAQSHEAIVRLFAEQAKGE